MSLLREISADLRRDDIDWSRGGQAFQKQFSSALQSIHTGLYGSIYGNATEDEVWDNFRSKDKSRRKMLIRPRSHMFKFGKFESGVLARHYINRSHFHQRSADGSVTPDIFPLNLEALWVLDLSNVDLGAGINAAGVFESYWNQATQSWLTTQGYQDPAQANASESRWLAKRPADSAASAWLEQVAQKISCARNKLRLEPANKPSAPHDATVPLVAAQQQDGT